MLFRSEAVTDLRYVWTREHSIIGSDGWTRDDLEKLLALVTDGSLTPLVDRVVGLSGVAAAEQALEPVGSVPPATSLV